METNKNVQAKTVNVKQMQNKNRITELIREMESVDRNLQYLEKQTDIHKRKWRDLNEELTRLQAAVKKWNDQRYMQ